MKHTSIQDISSYNLKSININYSSATNMVVLEITKQVEVEGVPPYIKEVKSNLPLLSMPVNEEGEYVFLKLLSDLSKFGFVKNETVPVGFRLGKFSVMPKGDLKVHYDSQTGSGHKKLNLHRVEGDIKRVAGIEHRILSEEDTHKVLAIIKKLKEHMYDVFVLGKVQQLEEVSF